MVIETLEDWNIRLGYCGCCEMPSCPTPEQECQDMAGVASVDGFGPYVNPGGDSVDDIPTIYGTKEIVDEDKLPSGSSDRFESYVVFPDEASYEALVSATFTDGVETITENTQNYWDETTQECYTGIYGETPPQPIGFGDWPLVSDVQPCTADSFIRTQTFKSTSGSPHSLLGCGQLHPDTGLEEYWDFTKEIKSGFQLTNAKTKAELRADALDAMPDSWPSTPEGSGCIASYVTTWPTIGDIGEWPDCPEGPPSASATTTLTKSRYRWKIPASWAGTYFKITWDIVFFPDGWDATIDDPDYVPPDPLPDPPPPIPQIPDPDAPPPSFVSEDLTYEWTGGGRTSGWNEIDVPTEEGESRIVNVRFVCYRSPYGVMPQVTGEAYEPPA